MLCPRHKGYIFINFFSKCLNWVKFIGENEMKDFFKRSPMQELSAHSGKLDKNLNWAVRIIFH